MRMVRQRQRQFTRTVSVSVGTVIIIRRIYRMTLRNKQKSLYQVCTKVMCEKPYCNRVLVKYGYCCSIKPPSTTPIPTTLLQSLYQVCTKSSIKDNSQLGVHYEISITDAFINAYVKNAYLMRFNPMFSNPSFPNTIVHTCLT